MPVRLRARSLSRVGVVSMRSSSSAVVGGAAHVVVAAHGQAWWRCWQRLRVEAALEDRFDAAVAVGLDGQRPPAGGFQALAAVAMTQPDDAEAGAEALLRVGTVLQDVLRH